MNRLEAAGFVLGLILAGLVSYAVSGQSTQQDARNRGYAEMLEAREQIELNAARTRVAQGTATATDRAKVELHDTFAPGGEFDRGMQRFQPAIDRWNAERTRRDAGQK
jgi:hypothetical protein